MSTAFKPITREAAAELLSVSLRAIDCYIEHGVLPAPISLGGRRRYWHPDVFYAHLDAILHPADPTASAAAVANTPEQPDRPVAAQLQPAAPRRSAPAPTRITKARAQTAARLEKLNSE